MHAAMLTPGVMSAGVLPWQPWLDCLQSNAVFGHVCALSDSLLQHSVNGADGDNSTPWTAIRLLLQRLYSKEGRLRHAAAQHLVLLVAGGPGLLDDSAIEGRHLF